MTTLNPSDLPLSPELTDAGQDAQAAADVVTHGVLAEYDSVDAVIEAAKYCRDQGYKKFDIHAPFPIHGLEAAMGMRYTVLPFIVLCCGLTGLTIGTLMTTGLMGGLLEWFGMNYAPGLIESLQPYAYLISGKPLGEIPQYIPPMFELTILLSAFGAVFGMFLLNGLPLLYHPLYRVDRFRRATDDRFFVVVQANDPKFDEQKTSELLGKTQPISVEVVQDEF